MNNRNTESFKKFAISTIMNGYTVVQKGLNFTRVDFRRPYEWLWNVCFKYVDR